MLHATCDNTSASALYLKHRFVRLRRHRGFYRLPSLHAPPTEQIVLDAFVFALPLHVSSTPAPLIHRSWCGGGDGAVAVASVSDVRQPRAASTRARAVPCCANTAVKANARCEQCSVELPTRDEDEDDFSLLLDEPDSPAEPWEGTCSVSVHSMAHSMLRAVINTVTALVPLRGWLPVFRRRGGDAVGSAKAATAAAGVSGVRGGSRALPHGGNAVVDLEAGAVSGEASAARSQCRGRGVQGGKQAAAASELVCSGEGLGGALRYLFKRTAR